MKIPAYKQKCKVDNCDNYQKALGLCSMHWWRLKFKNDLNYSRQKICNKCESKVFGNGMCQKHYNESRKDSGYMKIDREKITRRFTDSKRDAERYRGIIWTITLEEFTELNTKLCHYCNNQLPRTRSGLDRKDNTKGYTIDNVVPCCTFCNHLKSDCFTYNEFLEFSRTDLFKKIRAHGKLSKKHI